VGQFWLGLAYSVVILYMLDIFIPSDLGGVYWPHAGDVFWAEDGK